MTAVARPALAQGELSARWSGCPPDGAVEADPANACPFDFSTRRLVLAISPAVDVSQVVGWTLVLDLVSDDSTLPSWWQVQPGGCRSTTPGQFTAATPNGTEGCTDAWSTAGSALVQSLLYPRPGGDARQMRVLLGVGVSAPDAFDLTAGELYLAGILSIGFVGTTSGTCPGCTSPVCFVFNSAEVLRVPGAPGEPPAIFETPSPAFGNQATWAGGSACAAVPAVARTWGQIKTLYR